MELTFIVVLSLLPASVVTAKAFAYNQNNSENRCQIHYELIICQGVFNLSSFLLTQATLYSVYDLRIGNTSLTVLDQDILQNYNFTINSILIDAAPNLEFIATDAFSNLQSSLWGFRAINTKLKPSVFQNRFLNFSHLQEFYIGKQSRCPDSAIIYPCTCREGYLGRTEISGSGTIWSNDGFGYTTEITCEKIDGKGIKEIFTKLSKTNHTPKYFDVINLSGSNVTYIPENMFQNVTFSRVHINEVALHGIHANAFSSSSVGIQVLEIIEANFTSATLSETEGIFQALKSLTNLRILLLFECGLPHIPTHSSNDSKKLSKQLRDIVISLDRKRYSRGVTSIGSYAFSWAPNLRKIGLAKNYINHFEPFAFAFNETLIKDTPLTIDISGNPFNDESFAPNALSSAGRPLMIKFNIDSFSASDPANDPSLTKFPKNVFRPFLEEDSRNTFEIDYYNVDIFCDCSSAWMFEDSGVLKERIQNGLRIKRLVGNLVDVYFSSIQCNTNSSFKCLPNCLTFPQNQLLHCGKGQSIKYDEKYNITKLIYSSKDLNLLRKNATGSLKLNEISLIGCTNLEEVHPLAFDSSISSLQDFKTMNTNVKQLPNFGRFPHLTSLTFDSKYTLNSSMLDFSALNASSIAAVFDNANPLIVQLGNGGNIDKSTFTKLVNKTITVFIQENKVYKTMGQITKCSPTDLILNESTFKPVLEANPKNKFLSLCYLSCSCELKWLNDNWDEIRERMHIWMINNGPEKDFSCLPQGVNITNPDNFWGIDVTKFENGSYFTENC